MRVQLEELRSELSPCGVLSPEQNSGRFSLLFCRQVKREKTVAERRLLRRQSGRPFFFVIKTTRHQSLSLCDTSFASGDRALFKYTLRPLTFFCCRQHPPNLAFLPACSIAARATMLLSPSCVLCARVLAFHIFLERSLEWWEVALRYMESTRDDGNFVQRVSEKKVQEGALLCSSVARPR